MQVLQDNFSGKTLYTSYPQAKFKKKISKIEIFRHILPIHRYQKRYLLILNHVTPYPVRN
jgi:hypothetical protein